MNVTHFWRSAALLEFLLIILVLLFIAFSFFGKCSNNLQADENSAILVNKGFTKIVKDRIHSEKKLFERNVQDFLIIEKGDTIESQVRYICEYLYPDVSAELVLGIIYAESRFTPDIVDSSGSYYGLMQIGPRWHQDRMGRLGVEDLLDPYSNILVGVDYLDELQKTLEDPSVESILQAYRGVRDTSYFSTVLSFAYDLSREVH